ncbi:MAG: BCCT family transporter, partial [Euryhalocaulis sp.]|uniref:BCCT family transporter n=1 Tax=Euryhalocaulis sp. TaxID=2744307 RepID=UPI0017ADE5CF
MEHAQPKEKTLEPAVFFPAAIVIFAVVIFAFVAPDYASTAFTDVQSWIAINVGWLYLLGVFLFLGVSIVIAFSSWGRIRLGPQDSTPDYSFTSWFAMLFSAGMGIGLMFYGVAEPIIHFTSPPGGADGGTVEAARQAMVTTFFH